MTSVEDYEQAIEDSGIDTESLTLLVVRGATRDEVAAALGVDLGVPQDPSDAFEDSSAYTFLPVDGGILAMEPSGYADPAIDTLVALSAGGRAAAVVRGNIQAHTRFGAARDGELVFDDHEYTFVDDLDSVPAELREIFDLAWVDLDDEDAEPEADDIAAGLAMAEVVTGVPITADHLARIWDGPFFRAPHLVYRRD